MEVDVAMSFWQTSTHTHVRSCFHNEWERNKGNFWSWLEKANAEIFFAVGMRWEKKWKAELTRQVSYAVHWSPSHTFPSTAYQSCGLWCAGRFFSYIILDWQSTRRVEKVISFQFRCLQIGQISLLYSIYLKTALIHFSIYDDDDVAVVG